MAVCRQGAIIGELDGNDPVKITFRDTPKRFIVLAAFVKQSGVDRSEPGFGRRSTVLRPISRTIDKLKPPGNFL